MVNLKLYFISSVFMKTLPVIITILGFLIIALTISNTITYLGLNTVTLKEFTKFINAWTTPGAYPGVIGNLSNGKINLGIIQFWSIGNVNQVCYGKNCALINFGFGNLTFNIKNFIIEHSTPHTKFKYVKNISRSLSLKIRIKLIKYFSIFNITFTSYSWCCKKVKTLIQFNYTKQILIKQVVSGNNIVEENRSQIERIELSCVKDCNHIKVNEGKYRFLINWEDCKSCDWDYRDVVLNITLKFLEDSEKLNITLKFIRCKGGYKHEYYFNNSLLFTKDYGDVIENKTIIKYVNVTKIVILRIEELT